MTQDFRLTGLKGDGGTGLKAYEISGDGLWNATSGFDEDDGGAAQHGTQAGPNWLQIEIAPDGSTYTLRTSADGSSWDDEFTDVVPDPFGDVTDATQAGIACFFDGTDTGNFSVAITLWIAEPPIVLWTPTELGADVIAWYDAMDSANFALSGSTVTQWNDLAATPHHLTSESGKQPTRQTVADFGGANAVKFDGSDDYLKSASWTEGQPATVCSIYRTGATIDDLEVHFDGRTAAGTAITSSMKWSGASNQPHCFGGNAVSRHAAVLSVSTTYIDILDTSGTAGKTYMNGNNPNPSSFNQGAPAQTIISGINIGGSSFASGLASFGGHMAEFIIVNRVLTTLERQKVEGYMAHRWGRASNLPGGHPYKTDPPTL